MLGLWLVCMHDRHCRMLWSEYRRSRRKAWIEIENMTAFMNGLMVAPFMGAWIEIEAGRFGQVGGSGRSFHGSVD